MFQNIVKNLLAIFKLEKGRHRRQDENPGREHQPVAGESRGGRDGRDRAKDAESVHSEHESRVGLCVRRTRS